MRASPIHRSKGWPRARWARAPGRPTSPAPRSSSQRITPPAASSQQALPPASSTVHLLDGVERREQLGLARAGRGAAHVDAARAPAASHHHRAAGGPARVAEMSRRRGRPRRRWNQSCRHGSQLPSRGEHARRVLHARARPSPSWCSESPNVISSTVRRFEVVAAGVLVGHADAAVQLDALLADEAHRLAELVFRLRLMARRRCAGAASPS